MASKKIIAQNRILTPPFLDKDFDFEKLLKHEIVEILDYCEIEVEKNLLKPKLYEILNKEVIKNIEIYRKTFDVKEVPIEYKKIGDVVVSDEYFLNK